jgi:predicted nucleic acid-binding protein
VIYLGDTSALSRIYRRQVEQQWHESVEHGLVAICEPVLAEVLTIAEAGKYEEREADFLSLYPWVVVPDNAWEVVRSTRRVLARRSAHQGISVADYLVVATALHHELTVLHEDADFETVAAVVPELRQQRISALPESAKG